MQKELVTAISNLLATESVKRTIAGLKGKLEKSDEPYVWNVFKTEPLGIKLPKEIKSTWIFVLKKDRHSILHYHPNSTQHTVVIEGRGRIKIGNVCKVLRLFDLTERSIYVIDKNIPHEFYPEAEDMVVLSYHTCLSNDLMEIRCDSGAKRRYKNYGNDKEAG
ncbi:MAG TPA: cupin domain-containing protein [bacterium (Candidatus Stahlbacteria)]|nr:cupin domain-containing protein [Candidatus Stahlbacteria bacterium]